MCWMLFLIIQILVALSAGAVEYADCTSAEGLKPPQRGYLLAVGGDPWCLRTGSWWLSSNWPENRVVKSLATHHFGPYWARRAVGEARSDQSAGHDSTLLDF